MDRADEALKKWPQRLGDPYVQVMEAEASELAQLADEMQSAGVGKVEVGRTHRYLGSVYSDLAPALGKQMLLKAMQAYGESEGFLGGCEDPLEQAKLDFCVANALRQYDRNDVGRLEEAERKFLAAGRVFAEHSPDHTSAVEEALSSTRALLEAARLANLVERGRAEAQTLQEELEAGGDVREIAAKWQEVRERGGGPAGLFASVQAAVEGLPESAKHGAEFNRLTEQMGDLVPLVHAAEGPTDSKERELMDLLRDKLDEEVEAGRVTEDRASTLSDLIAGFAKTLKHDDDVPSLMRSVAEMRAKIGSQFENLHYLSHGLPRPPEGSRAAALIELLWRLRLFVLEEMNQREYSDEEKRLVLDLHVRAASLDKRIYEAGSDDDRAMVVDLEALRPFALEVRRFAARHHPMLAKPIWGTADVEVSTNSILYVGSDELRPLIEAVSRDLSFELMPTPTGDNAAALCWRQLQQAYVCVFDLRVPAGPERAAVSYELGIARALGKPLVVLALQDQTVPFDVDVQPVMLSRDSVDESVLRDAIDRASVWTMARSQSGAIRETVQQVLARYPIPQGDTYVDQTLAQLAALQADPEPVTAQAALRALLSFLGDRGLTLIHPAWPPVYADPERLRLFHVMPFRPEWADVAAERAEALCIRAGVEYVRGDRVEDPNVIRSIWEEIGRATHVLVDLTDFNENVSLELGIAHALGRPTLVVGQGDSVERLFPMIAKLRFHTYEDPAGHELDALLSGFLEGATPGHERTPRPEATTADEEAAYTPSRTSLDQVELRTDVGLKDLEFSALTRTLSKASRFLAVGVAGSLSAGLLALIFFGAAATPTAVGLTALGLILASGVLGWLGWAFLVQARRLMHRVEFDLGVDPAEIKATLAGISLLSVSTLAVRTLCFLAFLGIVRTTVNSHVVLTLLIGTPYLLVTCYPQIRYFNPNNWDSGSWLMRREFKSHIGSLHGVFTAEDRQASPLLGALGAALVRGFESGVADIAPILNTIVRKYGVLRYLISGESGPIYEDLSDMLTDTAVASATKEISEHRGELTGKQRGILANVAEAIVRGHPHLAAKELMKLGLTDSQKQAIDEQLSPTQRLLLGEAVVDALTQHSEMTEQEVV